MTTPPTTKPDLLARIRERWDRLQTLVEGLSPEDTERALGDGWSAKVHVAHITAWERSLLGLLRSQERWEAMGIPRLLWEGHDTDAINAHIAEASTTQDLAQVRAESLATHVELIEQLEAMSQEDLEKPYSHYQPGDLPYNENPVAGWVHGNTWDHYDEHIGWLESGLRA